MAEEWAGAERALSMARRVSGFAANLRDAHDLGIPHGEHREPWSLEFQRLAVPVYKQTLPTSYQVQVNRAFGTVGAWMLTHPQPETGDDWSIVGGYLDAVARAIAEDLGEQAPEMSGSDLEAIEIEPTTPAVMRYDELAQLVHPDGIERLRMAADGVTHHITSSGMDAPPKLQRQMLTALARGDRVSTMAEELGYSERSMYRRLNSLYESLGVQGRAQAVAKAAEAGWLS